MPRLRLLGWSHSSLWMPYLATKVCFNRPSLFSPNLQLGQVLFILESVLRVSETVTGGFLKPCVLVDWSHWSFHSLLLFFFVHFFFHLLMHWRVETLTKRGKYTLTFYKGVRAHNFFFLSFFLLLTLGLLGQSVTLPTFLFFSFFYLEQLSSEAHLIKKLIHTAGLAMFEP